MNVEKLGVILRRVHFVRWTLALITLNVVIFAFLVLPTQNKVAALQSNHATVRTRTAWKIRQLYKHLKLWGFYEKVANASSV